MIRTFRDKTPQLGKEVYVDDMAILIGDIVIGDGVGIYPYATIRGDDEAVVIGKNSNLQEHVIVHETTSKQTLVGEGVSVGHGAILHGCTIHNHVLIGMHATILDGVVIQEHTIVAAGSLCPPNKIYPPNSMVMGSPAKAVRELTDAEIQSIDDNAQHYVALSKAYLNQK